MTHPLAEENCICARVPNNPEERVGFNGACPVHSLVYWFDRAQKAEAAMQQIQCPLCGVTVVQVSSATLDLALWQHVNWGCKGSPRVQWGSASRTPVTIALNFDPPFDLAHKLQRLALDRAWRAYGHDAEYRERLVTWLRDHGRDVWHLLQSEGVLLPSRVHENASPDPPRQDSPGQENEPGSDD